MPASEQLKSLVNQIPDPAADGRYANLDPGQTEQIAKVVTQLCQGGREHVLGLIDLLVEPGKGDDVKAHFALHLLAVYVTQAGRESARAEFAQALASQIGGNRPKAVQAYLIEQLQLTGGKSEVAALGKVLLDPELCDTAARALVAIHEGAPEQLLAALPQVQGPSRLSLIDKLAVLRAAQAASVFQQALTDADPDVRIAGAWGLARIAAASGAEALLKCAETHQGWERINQTDACLALAEGLLAAGQKAAAAAIYGHLQKTRTDPAERHVAEAAGRGLLAAK
jgi:hypothetical protein